RSVHFGVYDYTASAGITAAYQTMGHLSCDFARQMMLISLAGTGVHLSDGATNILPVGPHRASDGEPLTAEQLQQNRHAVPGAACGAITEDQARATGLTLDELRSRSFLKILQNRRCS